MSGVRGHGEVAIGNIVGSNLFNIMGILGLGAIVSSIPVAGETIASDNWWMLGITLLLFPVVYTGLRISRLEGALLLAVYGSYLFVLLGR